MVVLQRKMSQLESVKGSLAEFFCEELQTFKFEECFRVFHHFYVKLRQAIADNQRRQYQEEQMTLRRKQREEILALRRQQLSEQMDCDNQLDTQIYECFANNPHRKLSRKSTNGTVNSEEDQSINGSPYLSRKRFGSLTRPDPSDGSDKRSPDVTPNGSLRRRRNRVLSDEDDSNLMQFLRSSDHRERPAYGSLDRSWARQHLQGTSKQRTPLPETDTLSTAKDLRQKIESWLQHSNETMTPTTNLTKEKTEKAEIESTPLTPLVEEKTNEPRLDISNRKEMIAALKQVDPSDTVTIYIRAPDKLDVKSNKFGTLPRTRQQTCEDPDDEYGKFERLSSMRKSKRYKRTTNGTTVIGSVPITVLKSSDNDEGFEETQSQMSESASQATSSNDCCSGDTEANSGKSKETGKKNLVRKTSLPKSDIMKKATTPVGRTSMASVFQIGAEQKSISRNSLFSSKSSLNSVNTVKKAPLKTQVSTRSSLPRRAPLPSNLMGRSAIVTVPTTPAGIKANAAKPVTSRSFEPAFMKPTASSTTKSHLNRLTFSIRNSMTK